MRTSLNEMEQIERYITRQAEPGETLLFDARLILDPPLNDKLKAQQQAYALIEKYGRAQLHREIAAVQEKLFNDEEHQGFRRRIAGIFSRR